MIVVDSSVVLSWLFRDEHTTGTDALLRQVLQSGAIVPSLLKLEVANALEMAVRRRRIDAAFRDASLRDLLAFPIAVDVDTDRNAWGSTLSLAVQHGLTVYDAAYLELAQRLRLPLATLDHELREACRRAKVQTLPKQT
ncbi:MAG: type II toxin-antitoxin system VapC family toxin [Burkholderiales bacterium]|nr:type II toxin-antitoxin system VapC family toxin [Burkholderiales bacterium]